MARLTQDQRHCVKLSSLLFFITALAVTLAAVVPGKGAAIFCALLAGIALTLFSVSLAVLLDSDDEYWDTAMKEIADCPHESVYTTRDPAGDTFYFCDLCGDQVDKPGLD